MSKSKRKDTPGQKLWYYLYRADLHDIQAEKVIVSAHSSRVDPAVTTKRWFEGMSRDLKKRFLSALREQREKLNLTQQQLADASGLTVTAVAMIERGERVPSLDTAAKLCWALDVEAGVMTDELS